MASIFTRKGEEIFIDDEDFDFVNQFTWSLDGAGYPHAGVPGTRTTVRLHECLVPADGVVNHINRNKLDARRKNLEDTTQKRNIQKRLKLPHTGITKSGSGFTARLTAVVDGTSKNIYFGTFKTFDLALLARIIGEIRYWGEPTQQMS
jgi:hypothetical protein